MAPSVTRRVVLTAIVALLSGCEQRAAPSSIRVKLGGKNFTLELAATRRRIEQGMMGRTELDADSGMLFVFADAEPRRFWMKNCLIPLDLLFLDDAGRIVAVHTMDVPAPGTPDSELHYYPSTWPARYAIEINAGRAMELGLKPGDTVPLPFHRLHATGGE